MLHIIEIVGFNIYILLPLRLMGVFLLLSGPCKHIYMFILFDFHFLATEEQYDKDVRDSKSEK